MIRRTDPMIPNHLLKYKDKLLARDKTETGIRYEWYCILKRLYIKNCHRGVHFRSIKKVFFYFQILRTSLYLITAYS